MANLPIIACNLYNSRRRIKRKRFVEAVLFRQRKARGLSPSAKSVCERETPFPVLSF